MDIRVLNLSVVTLHLQVLLMVMDILLAVYGFLESPQQIRAFLARYKMQQLKMSHLQTQIL